MSSRQEEKERRRQERLAREQAEARKAAMRRRLQVVAGAILAIAAAAAIAVAATSGGGGDDDGSGPQQAADGPSVPIPAREIADLEDAAKAAGCTLRTFPSEGRTHIGDTESFDAYKTNPPTSGTHRDTPAQDGIYEAGNEPDQNNLVHTLEHGRVIFQYAPGTPRRRVQQLETLFNEPLRGSEGYHTVLMQNNSDMPYAVAAVAWTQLMGCREFTDRTFDALRAFRERYVDKGPELVP